MRGSEVDKQATEQDFIQSSPVFSQRKPLGSIHAQLTKAMSSLPACHACPAPGEEEFGEVR